MVAIVVLITATATAQTTSLTTEVITWNTIGLDSNDVNAGMNLFLVGVRVCDVADGVDAEGVRADFSWDSANTYVNLQNGIDALLVQSSGSDPNDPFLDPNDPNDVALSIIPDGQCFDFYFNVEITRDANAYDTTRDYHVDVSANNAATVSTPANRELYVEHIVSQKRNKNVAITGPASVWVGGIFEFTMSAETATNGYEQIDAHITFPNTVFQVIAAETSYTATSGGAASPVDSVYNDACGWIEDTSDPNYHSCSGTGKAGDTVTQSYFVKIMSLPPTWDPNDPNTTTLTLNGVIYDYSGSSYHYNNNFSSETFTFEITPQPTLARFRRAGAEQNGSDVTIRWNTAREVDNLGFHVWREMDGRRVRVTPSLVAGSALLGGPGLVLAAGNEYSWFDRAPPDQRPVYWIESVSTSGTSDWTGPIVPTRNERGVDTPDDLRHSAPLLRDSSRFAPAGGWKGHHRVLGALATRTSSSRFGVSAADDSATKTQQTLAAGDAVKITVDEDGWQRVSQAELVAAGLGTTVESKGLRLYVDGDEIPFVVADGGDGQLDPGDSISFYGVALDTIYGNDRVYWLESGNGPGDRIATIASKKSLPASTASSFPFTVERRDRFAFFAALLSDDDEENWFGSTVDSGITNQHLEVSHLDTDGTTARLDVVLQGVTDDLSLQQDHKVRVEVNGTYLGLMVFDGRESASETFSFPASALIEGTNTVSLSGTDGDDDISLVDRIRLTYPHTYEVDDDWLRFSVEGSTAASVNGFSNGDILVLDITDEDHPVRVAADASESDGLWSASFAVPGQGERILVAITSQSALSPASLRHNEPSRWNDRQNGADFVIIADGAMSEAAESLATRRASQGLAVAIIDAEDLYDEYSFGAKDPRAIKSFLEDASTNWRTRPGHVLLLGDASIDPRDYLGFGGDLVPTFLRSTAFNKAPSDEWFVDFDGDDVGELTIGRLPASSVAEAETMIGKTLAYETTDNSDGWNRHAVIVADIDDPGNAFSGKIDRIAQVIPDDLMIDELDANAIGVGGLRTELLQRWNAGAGLITYFGHGSVGSWGRSGFLSSGDLPGLSNEGRLPVVAGMTCLTGFFHHPFVESLAEVALQSNSGGAVAVWGSSGLTHLTNQVSAAKELVEAFAAEGRTLGEAVRLAKQATSNDDVKRTWILFGDPTLTMRR